MILRPPNEAWNFSKRLPLVRAGTDKWEASFEVPAPDMDKFLMFVFYDGAANRWIKHGHHDFEFEMPFHEEWGRTQKELEVESVQDTPIQLFSHLGYSQQVKKTVQEDGLATKGQFLDGRPGRQARADISFTPFELQGDFGSLDVSCISQGQSRAKVEIRAWLHPRLGECMLHFGVFETPQSTEWTSATQIRSVDWPSDMRKIDHQACQASLRKMTGGMHALDFTMAAHAEVEGNQTIHVPEIAGFGFVLKTVQNGIWVKPAHGGDAVVRFSQPARCHWNAERGDGTWAQVADTIVQQEMGNNMSLKLRYENCLHFLDVFERVSGSQMRRLQSWRTLLQVDSSKAVWSRTPSMPLIHESTDDEEFWSWIFVWQRLSFQQLLTWERNWVAVKELNSNYHSGKPY